MKQHKRPYDVILQTITQYYTYNPDTGNVCKDGKPMGRRKAEYLIVHVGTSDPDYVSVQCNLPAHCIAWYLTHGVWAETDLDHIDGDGTNNKLNNLRLATRSQNNFNRRKQTKPASSQYKGVSYDKRHSKWHTYIRQDGKKKTIGYFATEEEAARVYDTHALLLCGEYARLNFPPTTLPHTSVEGQAAG